MRLAANAVAIVALLQGAFAETARVPQCLAACLKNVTNSCDAGSLGELITCLNGQCIDAASGTTLMLSPKAQYSCQQSLIPGPGTEESPSPMTVVGDARCVTNPFDFRSFTPSTGPSSHMDVLAQECRLDIFPGQNCIGDVQRLDLHAFEENKCVFYGGRSVRMQCHEPFAPSLKPYRYLEHMCANSTSAPATGSSPLPSPYGIPGTANNTLHLPSIGSHKTATASPRLTPYASTLPNHAKVTSSSSGSASNEQASKPSIVALVAVFAAAILML